MRLLVRVAAGAVLAAVLLWGAAGDYRPTTLELAVAPYRYDLAGWEFANFFDKWTNKLAESLPWNSPPPRQERIADAQEFFELGNELRELERLDQAGRGTPESPSQIGEIKSRRSSLRPEVEETIESEIGAVLNQEGFASRVGLIFPPVDTVYARSPGVLVLSPRDRIFRLSSQLLRPGIDDRERAALEDLVLREKDLSALVEDTGGVAAYPSVVSDSGSLHDALITTAHEWLHHWFFFHPLGQHYWDNADMTTLNETAATLGGQAIGDRVFTAMTGEVVRRRDGGPPPSDSGGFDFNAEMRQTRHRTDELLAEGRVQDAESYMKERRRFLEEHGYYIRKLNQAYFAFHGSYATSAASISPIDRQLKELEGRSASLADFLKTVAEFGSYQEFVDSLGG